MSKTKNIDIVIGALLFIMGVLLVFISVEVYKLNNNPRYNVEIEEVEPSPDLQESMRRN